MEIVEHNDSVMKIQRANATWLGVIDIYKNSPVKLTVDKVVLCKGAKFENGRTEDKQAIIFKETKKMLPLNATNSRAFAKKYAADAKDAPGKVVTLEVYRLPREFNGHTHGIRLV